MILVLFGPPGSGKGTQSQFLVEKYGFVHVSTGNMLRDEIKKGTELGNQIKDIIDAGQLVSDNIVGMLISNILGSCKDKSFIFDGFPRNTSQAENFDVILSQFGKKVDLVLDFVIDFDDLGDRITGRYTCSTCGALYHDSNKLPQVPGVCDVCSGRVFERRKDDQLDVLKERVKVYIHETEALTQLYGERGLLHVINASEEVDVVKGKVIDCLMTEGFIEN